MANVELPAALRAHAGNQRVITVAATTVGAALQAVQQAHPALHGFLLDSTGAVPRHIVIFVGAADIRHNQGLNTAVTDGTVITVLLPVAGGAGAAASHGPALSSADIMRYGRQLLLPWMSGRAQLQFRAARVSIVLCANDTASHWLCLYLAHAGVGHVELQGAAQICDGLITPHDALGSPLLHTADIGAPRATTLQARLLQRVPQLHVSITNTSTADALQTHGNGASSHAMWHGSHVAATWLRRTADSPDEDHRGESSRP